MKASSFLLRVSKLELSETLGQALKEFRLSRGLSQEHVGASQSYVSDIERGLKTLSIEKLHEFASCIGVHPISIIARCYLIKDKSISEENLMAILQQDLETLKK
ncbi:helix-turn-helix protein [Pseudomonas sp. 478]|uniref:helix-turn-helix domain-containing protein n=1 Tax=unclassified Pseudomonas TaxID=196821 RepID=UPI000DAE8F4F|nr:helix-turn-helix protein [Pseudomonas sp. 478]TCV52089.1 helix-turn-helix protein [Pseudomonas sp. 460]